MGGADAAAVRAFRGQIGCYYRRHLRGALDVNNVVPSAQSTEVVFNCQWLWPLDGQRNDGDFVAAFLELPKEFPRVDADSPHRLEGADECYLRPVGPPASCSILSTILSMV